ncbi:MAG: hypothetical protein ICV54_01380 [Nostoc sp. C3-bin3]|nr:hypothetical protein [Nostoc sp. C3-bin3]
MKKFDSPKVIFWFVAFGLGWWLFSLATKDILIESRFCSAAHFDFLKCAGVLE